jgi:hypothetical protein
LPTSASPTDSPTTPPPRESQAKGNQTSVVVAVVSTILAMLLVFAVVIFVKKYRSKAAYHAAKMVHGNGADDAGGEGDDVAMLSLNQKNSMYEDTDSQ